MYNVSIQEIKKNINKKLEANMLPAKILQSKFKIGIVSSLHNDPTFMPFYFHLGKLLKVKKIIEFGFDLGVSSGSLIEGSAGVEKFLAFRRKGDYFTKRLGISNIHSILKKKFDLWIGTETDPEFMKMVLLNKWDCAIICEQGQSEQTYRAYLDLIWNQINYDGFIVFDFLNEPMAKSAFDSFCKLQNHNYVTFNTLRGTGIIQK